MPLGGGQVQPAGAHPRPSPITDSGALCLGFPMKTAEAKPPSARSIAAIWGSIRPLPGPSLLSGGASALCLVHPCYLGEHLPSAQSIPAIWGSISPSTTETSRAFLQFPESRLGLQSQGKDQEVTGGPGGWDLGVQISREMGVKGPFLQAPPGRGCKRQLPKIH